MGIIFVIGPAYKRLKVLLDTIDNNNKLINNIKHFYIATNDKDVEKYFINSNIENITCKFFHENQGHQISCYNSIIFGMKMVLENNNNTDNDKVIFCHEDCYVNNIDLFNKALHKLDKYDLVCREYNEVAKKRKYFMNDTFLINENVIKKTFCDLNIIYNFNSEKNPTNRFCEYFFTKNIQNLYIYSILYTHSTLGDTELGFYHSLPNDRRNLWQKKNIDILYNDDN